MEKDEEGEVVEKEDTISKEDEKSGGRGHKKCCYWIFLCVSC
jgi:hypothetical protein